MQVRVCRSVSGSRVEARGVSRMVKVVVAAGSDAMAVMVRCVVTGAVKHGDAVMSDAMVCCRKLVARWLKAALQLVRGDDGWMREDGFSSHIPEAKKSLYGSRSFATETSRPNMPRV
ncbi:hypothetical protein DEO72_LG6g113 [Vigna unguiculata]|uniref:Uncharacterized protein n=1 Tax=Vigna unguiculata TaxID=3917 RepID=A0A4D6M3U2_VIGUN|nr:hypothetical protein DEO72_LG6g113 [Vigna unguiculata]